MEHFEDCPPKLVYPDSIRDESALRKQEVRRRCVHALTNADEVDLSDPQNQVILTPDESYRNRYRDDDTTEFETVTLEDLGDGDDLVLGPAPETPEDVEKRMREANEEALKRHLQKTTEGRQYRKRREKRNLRRR